MKILSLPLILNLFSVICTAREPVVLNFFERKDITQQEVRDADVLLYVHESNLNLLKPDLAMGKTIENIWIDEQPVTVRDTDLSRCQFVGGCFVDMTFRNVSFENAVFLPPKKTELYMPQQGSFCFEGENLNLKNVFFQRECYLYISGQHFMKTMNYQLRETDNLSICGDFSETDLCGFRFQTIEFTKAENTQTDGLAFSQGACFHAGITKEQICATWNYQTGVLKNVTFLNGCELPDDFRNFYFVDCWIHCSVHNVDFTDAKLINCSITSDNLSLEQVKSTWNYKNNRMNLSKWPDSIMKALENEK